MHYVYLRMYINMYLHVCSHGSLFAQAVGGFMNEVCMYECIICIYVSVQIWIKNVYSYESLFAHACWRIYGWSVYACTNLCMYMKMYVHLCISHESLNAQLCFRIYGRVMHVCMYICTNACMYKTCIYTYKLTHIHKSAYFFLAHWTSRCTLLHIQHIKSVQIWM